MNFCPNCGAQVNQENAFCESCGSPIKKQVYQQAPQAAPQQAPRPMQYQAPKKKMSGLTIGIIIAAVVVVLAGATIILNLVFGLGFFGVNKPVATTVPNVTPTQTAVPTTAVTGTPEDAVKAYYDNLLAIKYAASYDALSSANKDAASEKDFLLWKYLKKKYSIDKSYKYVKGIEEANKSVDGRVYEKVITFKITKNFKDSSYKKPNQTTTYDDYVVYENGGWKLHIPGMNIKTFIAYAYSDIAYKYEQGRGYSKNFRKAILNYKYALEYKYRDGFTHHGLAYCYKGLKKLKTAIPYIKNAIDFYTTKVEKAEACVTAGNIYYSLHNKSKAKAYYKTALKLDPKNTDAKQNLKNI